jgi:hypothetical protein
MGAFRCMQANCSYSSDSSSLLKKHLANHGSKNCRTDCVGLLHYFDFFQRLQTMNVTSVISSVKASIIY